MDYKDSLLTNASQGMGNYGMSSALGAYVPVGISGPITPARD